MGTGKAVAKHRDLQPMPSVVASTSLGILLLGSQVLCAQPLLTLQEAVETAADRSEIILRAQEEETIAHAAVSSASTMAMPKVFVKGTAAKRDSAGQTGGFGGDEREQAYYLSIQQPVYHGLRDRLQLRATRALLAAREADTAAIRTQLQQEALHRFFAVLDAQLQLKLNRTAADLQQSRVDVLQRRVEADDLRRSDLLQARSALQDLQITEGSLQEREKQARVALQLLIADRAHAPIATPEPRDCPFRDGNQHLARALSQRAELVALAHQIEATSYAAKMVEREAHPDIDLTVNTYAYREGSLKDSVWDANITLSWELSGRKDRRARQRQQKAQQTQLVLADREVRKQITQAYDAAATTLRQSRVIQTRMSERIATTRELHQIVTAEYAAGDASELEIQTAFSAWQQALQALEREKLREQLFRFDLYLICGENPWSNRTH